MRTLIGIATGITFLAVVFVGSQDLVWAGGGGAPPSCPIPLTKNVRPFILGTIAVSTADPGSGMESILRLEYGGKEQFFRGTTGAALSDLQIICDSLDSAVSDTGQTIKQFFGIPASARLVMQCDALSGGSFDCHRSIRDASTLGSAPTTIFGLSTGLADVRITVMQ